MVAKTVFLSAVTLGQTRTALKGKRSKGLFGLGTLGTVALGFAGYRLFQRSNRLGKIEFTVGDFKIHKISLKTTDCVLVLRIINPTAETARVENIFLNFVYSGKIVGTLNSNTPFTVQPKKVVEQSMAVTIENASLLASASTFLITGKLDKKITIKGYIRAEGIELPVNEERELKK